MARSPSLVSISAFWLGSPVGSGNTVCIGGANNPKRESVIATAMATSVEHVVAMSVGTMMEPAA